MSEYINNAEKRKEELKKLFKNIHEGIDITQSKEYLSEMLASVNYNEVVKAEEELISEGMPVEEILKYCDLHSDALKGKLEKSNFSELPEGHPVSILVNENKELKKELNKIKHALADSTTEFSKLLMLLKTSLNNLADIEKHYIKKENLLFSHLETYNITGPSVVMWGKDNEVRSLLKLSFDLLNSNELSSKEDLTASAEFSLTPLIKAVEEMIFKEEEILFPMCLEAFNVNEWYSIVEQFDEIGFCLYVPEVVWVPEGLTESELSKSSGNTIKLGTGNFNVEELEGVLNAFPFDFTFVDKDDKVRYFSNGIERIFARSKAIIGRKVQNCHPPQSVNIVEKILDDFRNGRESAAKFWINFHNKMIHIAYYAIRNASGEYLGTLEVTQDITEIRALEGERRLLTYDK